MSIEYCANCHQHVDLDYNSEHFLVLTDGRSICARGKEIDDDETVRDEDGTIIGKLDY